MLGKLKLTQEGADIYRQAEAARGTFDFESASRLYHELSQTMVRTSYLNHSRRAFACAQFCHALASVQATGASEEALGMLSKSAREFELAQDQANVRRVRAYQKYFEGNGEAGDMDFEDASEAFRESAHQFTSLRSVFPEEKMKFESIAAESLLEAAVNETMHLALSGRFDDCKMSLADATRAVETLRVLPDWAEFAPLHESRFEFASALAPFLRGQFALRVLDSTSALKWLTEARPHLSAAIDSLSCGSALKPGWVHRKLQYTGTQASCAAAIRHAEAIRTVLDHGFWNVPELFMEVRNLYDAAAEQHARAGADGVLGAKSSAALRDLMGGIVCEIQRRVDPECFHLPEFSAITSSKDLLRILERDYRELIACFLAGAWKMTLVCAGGIMEAMLVDLLHANWSVVQGRCAGLARKDVSEVLSMTFDAMIKRSEEAGLLSPGNVYISDSLRCFRNHVHSKVEVRTKAVFGREDALAAIRAVRRFVTSRKAP